MILHGCDPISIYITAYYHTSLQLTNYSVSITLYTYDLYLQIITS